MTLSVTVLAQVFGTPSIISRNCTHISIKSYIMPETEQFEFAWVLITNNGTSSMTKEVVYCGINPSTKIIQVVRSSSSYLNLFSLSNHPTVLNKLPSPFNSTLTFTLLPYDHSLTYQLGIRYGFGSMKLEAVSHVFEKPQCHPTNGQTLKCEDQLCFCDTIVTEVCSSTLNYTGLCTYSENLESSVGTLLISKTCPQASSTLPGISWWGAVLLVIGIVIIITVGLIIIVKWRKSKDESQKSTIDNDEAKSLQETNT